MRGWAGARFPGRGRGARVGGDDEPQTTAAGSAGTETAIRAVVDAATAGRGDRTERQGMYIIVVGGGKVGYYLTKELLAAGHELVVMEKNAQRARQIADEVGSIVLARDGCEGKYLAEAGATRANIVAAVTGDDEDNLVVCQMAKHHFDVPRTIARVNNPQNEELFRHLGVDEIISPTRMALAAIEQDIPVHELLHLLQLEGGEVELVEAQIAEGSPAIGRRLGDIPLPAECSLFAIIRGERVQPVRADTVLERGDKVLAIAPPDAQDELHRELIGDETAEAPEVAAASSTSPG